ncbi:COG4315 family predicted lipoprotein [Lentzea sp. CA-135723]|uniref:COG4315 family predicted lipoprotein n=1 Tax=Lentzea sp. CA-135723 TaxID=3239950 RepID=UPI003D8BF57B
MTVLLVAGCAGEPSAESEPDSPAGPVVEPSTTRVLPGDIVTLRAIDVPGVGAVVADRQNNTLYRNEKDTTNPPKSTCLEPECTLVWPPLLAAKVETDGVDATLVGLMERPDGTKQVTLNGRPLYRYVDDENPGDAVGNGVDGVWFAVAPSGEKARAR